MSAAERLQAPATLLELRGVGKDYPRLASAGGQLRSFFALLRGAAVSDHYRALDAVSVDVRHGESLGVIGENGAGKSTLLKVIAGVIKPTRGSCQVHGRISALLELGSGFHPEYTGIENIDLAAALLGLSARELRAKRDEIIAFADIGEHIHQPIKHYSSGMIVRLGFAVATAVKPEILITDEVLAVGDGSFQKKCIRWIENFLADGGTLLMCSHSMYHVQKLCQRALWLHHGAQRMLGNSSEVTQAYLAYHEAKEAAAKAATGHIARVTQRAPVGAYSVIELRLENEAGEAIERTPYRGSFIVRGLAHSDDGRTPVVVVGMVRADGTPVYGVWSELDGYHPTRVDAHHFRFAIHFTDLPALPGKYAVRAHAMDPEALRLFDTWEIELTVTGDTREVGLCHLPHRWLDV
ncbi:MAG: ABC transporter ATP-binding protein [Burkholderiales bacterium]|nr:MAG: ABC transporter ATP-binding protein [Burkholderiales bacterium]